MVIHPADGLIHRLLRQSGQAPSPADRSTPARPRQDTVNISGQARARMMESANQDASAATEMRSERGQVDRLGEQLLQIYKRNGRAT